MTKSDIPTTDEFKFFTTAHIRFRDLDAMGHVNNAVYFTYLEMARAGYVVAIGLPESESASMTRKFPFILAEISCRFLSPALFGEELRVHLRTAAIGHKSFEFDYLITTAGSGRPVATAHSVQVCYDYEAGRSIPVPKFIRNCVENYEGQTFS